MGAVLYHLLSGRPPYDMHAVMILFDDYCKEEDLRKRSDLRRKLEEQLPLMLEAPPDRLSKGRIPATLIDICERAMAINPAVRFKTAQDLRRAVIQVRRHGVLPARELALPASEC